MGDVMMPVLAHPGSLIRHYNQMIDCVYSVTHRVHTVVMDVPQKDVDSTFVVLLVFATYVSLLVYMLVWTRPD
jgi:hypothetical protein